MTVSRTSQEVVETLSDVSAPNLVASQLVVEVMSANALKYIASQFVVEMLSENVADDANQRPVVFVVT